MEDTALILANNLFFPFSATDPLWPNLGGQGGSGCLPSAIAYFGISRLKILEVVNKYNF